MKSLLRLVEERAVVAWGAPGLRMAAARRPLARRLRRMLQPHYDPNPRVGAFALSALVLSVSLGCALSTAAPMRAQAPVEQPPNPALPRQSLYERGQALVGDEVAEVGPLGGHGGLARGGLPRYAAVLEKGEPPVLDVGDEELILAFMLAIDDRGNVESATLFRDSRTGPYEPISESTPESERLAAYLETFRFEPIVLSDGAPVQATVMIDLRVSARGVEVATRAGDREELERRLAEVYRLPDGRNLDLRPPPHPPERMILYRTGHPVQARGIPWGPDMMTIVWVGDRPTFRGAHFTSAEGIDLLSLMQTLGVRRGAVRFEGGAQNVRVAADVVMRDGASEEELLDDLPLALNERFGLDLGFRVVSEPSRTLVLSGSIGAVPPDDEQDGARVLHVFTDRRDEDPRSGSGGRAADAGGLVAMLSEHLDMPVVDATTGAAAEPFRVRLHDSAYETDLLDLLMQNLESQTDLDIAVEERLDRIVVVSPS